MLALLVAVAAGIGLLHQGLFWLIFSYAVLVAALISFAALWRRRGERLDALDAELATSRVEVAEASKALTQAETDLVAVQEELEASEGGYASLRAAVIQIAGSGGSDIEDFDEDLADALRGLARTRGSVAPDLPMGSEMSRRPMTT